MFLIRYDSMLSCVSRMLIVCWPVWFCMKLKTWWLPIAVIELGLGLQQLRLGTGLGFSIPQLTRPGEPATLLGTMTKTKSE